MTSPMPTFRARTLFAPLDANGRAGTVARRLAQAISLGLLLDGERLPAESELAIQFGVSPVTLREALASLREMGLIETRRGRGGGSFVRAPDEDRAAQLHERMSAVTLVELRDVCDHRAAVAGAAARLAAERALPGDVATLREHAERLRAAGSLTERRRLDARFHIEVAAAAQSPRLTREEMNLWSEVGDLVWLPVAPGQVASLASEHAALAGAIARQDPARARQLAEQHVQAELNRMLQFRLAIGP